MDPTTAYYVPRPTFSPKALAYLLVGGVVGATMFASALLAGFAAGASVVMFAKGTP